MGSARSGRKRAAIWAAAKRDGPVIAVLAHDGSCTAGSERLRLARKRDEQEESFAAQNLFIRLKLKGRDTKWNRR